MKKHFSSLGNGLLIFLFLFTSCDQISSFEEADLSLEQNQKIKEGFELERINKGSEKEGNRFFNLSGVIHQDATACENGECSLFEGSNNYGEFRFDEQFSSAAVSGSVYGNVLLTINDLNMAYFNIDYSSRMRTTSGEKPQVFVNGSFAGSFSDQSLIFGSSRELITYNEGPDYYYSELDGAYFFDYSKVECGDSFTFTFVLKISEEEFIFSQEFFLVPFCKSCDEESFQYSLDPLGDQSVDLRFSYNYEKEADVTLEFEFSQLELEDPKADSYVGTDGKFYTISTDKKTKILTWTGPVGCLVDEPTTFDFAGLLPECKGNGVSNKTRAIWSDTRVVAIDGVPLVDLAETPENEGPYSLKGDLEDLEFVGCKL